jgi:predicted ABC-type ATPase
MMPDNEHTAEIRNKLLQEGRNFYFETVFSHPSKIDFVAHAKALGYQIILMN